MGKVIILTGSARPNSAGHKAAPLVVDALKKVGLESDIVDAASLNLPFFDAPLSPSAEGYEPTNEAAIKWAKMVDESSAVVLLTPEYNGSVSAVQKNAVDWIFKEFNDKPVALVGYGWYVPSRAHVAWKPTLETIKAKLVGETQLQFMADINTEGEVADEASTSAKLTEVAEAIKAAV